MFTLFIKSNKLGRKALYLLISLLFLEFYGVFTAQKIKAQDCESSCGYHADMSWSPCCDDSAGCPVGYCCLVTVPAAGSCVKSSSNCFPAGTKVTLPNSSTKNIEDVKVGDQVLSEDGTGKQSVSTVKALEQPISNNLCEIKYTDGENLKVTKGHPLFTQNGWKAIDTKVAALEDPGVPVSTLTVGDFMKKDTGAWDQVSNISCKDEDIQTYNLTVDNSHTYFAGGFLAHNKGGSQCLGCGANSHSYQGSVYNVEVYRPTRYTPWEKINWQFDGTSGDSNQCDNKGVIFIGRDQAMVEANCHINPGDVTDITNPDIAPASRTPAKGGGGLGGTSLDSPTAGRNGFGGGGGGGSPRSDGSDTGANGGSGQVGVRFKKSQIPAYQAVNGQCVELTTDADPDIGCWWNQNGTFWVGSNIHTTVRIVVVAGGGSGGTYSGGGGGGGGVLARNDYPISSGAGATPYSVVVGAGGVWQDIPWFHYATGDDCGPCGWSPIPGYTGQGGNGGNSLFGDWAGGGAIGGGGGGSGGYSTCQPYGCGGDPVKDHGVANRVKNGVNGGSGGGAAFDLTAGQNAYGGLTRWCGGNGGNTHEGIDITTSTGGGGGGGGAGDNGPNGAGLLGCAGDQSHAGGTSYYRQGGSGGDGYCTDFWEPKWGEWCYGGGGQGSSGGFGYTGPELGCSWIRVVDATKGDVGYMADSSVGIVLQPGIDYYTRMVTETSLKSGGDTYCGGTTIIPASPSPTPTASPTPPPPTGEAWWQIKDSDLQTRGDLKSLIPTDLFFGLKGLGEFAGVPVYGGSITGIDDVNINETTAKWNVPTLVTNSKLYDYQFFANQIPTDTTINTIDSGDLTQSIVDGGDVDATTGYYWYKFDGTSGATTGLDLTLNEPISVPLGKKVILLINSANFNINSTINLTDGQGFFMVIVGKNSGGDKGSIIVNPSVGGGAEPNLEGLYVADNNFSDGTLQPGGNDSKLWVRGSVVAFGENGQEPINLQRDLGAATNVSTPSELFEYAPDQIMLFPSKLGVRRLNWKEVAP